MPAGILATPDPLQTAIQAFLPARRVHASTKPSDVAIAQLVYAAGSRGQNPASHQPDRAARVLKNVVFTPDPSDTTPNPCASTNVAVSLDESRVGVLPSLYWLSKTPASSSHSLISASSSARLA